MDQDRLDQLFKDSLYDHQTPIDKDQLWAAINGKKRRRAGWLMSLKLLGVLALLGIAVVWLKSNTSQTAEVTSEFTYTEVDNNTTQDINQSINHRTSSAPDTASAHKAAPEEANDKNENLRTTTTKSRLNTKENYQEKFSETKNTELNLSQNKKVRNSYVSTSRPPSSTISPTTPNLNLQTSSKTSLIPPSTQNTSTITKEASVPKANAKTEETFSTLTIDDLTYLASIANLNYERPEVLRQDKIECYDHRKKVHPFYAEIYSSIDYVTNRISATPDYLNYKEERDATQTQLEGYRAGLRLKYLTRCGLYFKAGLEVGAIRERFDRQERNTRTEIRPNQLLEVITQADTTIYIYGDAPVTIEENKIWKVFNTYRTVGIPILIGFQTELGRLTWGAELGGIYNLYYDFEGMLLDTSLMPAAEPDYFKSRISSSLTGGLNVGYNLNKSMSLMAYTSFKHNLSDINQSNNKVQQANTRIGVGLGLQFKL